MNRRKFLAFLAAGGVVTATGLWLPGQKLISIPKKPFHVYVDTDSPFTGTGYPIGTVRYPVNNWSDGMDIARKRGGILHHIYAKGFRLNIRSGNGGAITNVTQT